MSAVAQTNADLDPIRIEVGMIVFAGQTARWVCLQANRLHHPVFTNIVVVRSLPRQAAFLALADLAVNRRSVAGSGSASACQRN